MRCRMTLKKFMEKMEEGIRRIRSKEWAKAMRELAEYAWKEGRVEGKAREKARLERCFERVAFGWPGSMKSEVHGRMFWEPLKKALKKADDACEIWGCTRKATWDVCAANRRGVRTCGRHKAGPGLTLNMRRIKEQGRKRR